MSYQQTNGTILNDAWLDVFAAHGVNIGVSIDGDRRAHDRFRRDHRDRSTFDWVERNLRRLMDWAGDDPLRRPSTISVLDWRNDYRSIYDYLRGLGVRQMNFLLPDRSLDDGFSGADETARRYGQSLSEILGAWLAEDDPDISVRQIRELVTISGRSTILRIWLTRISKPIRSSSCKVTGQSRSTIPTSRRWTGTDKRHHGGWTRFPCASFSVSLIARICCFRRSRISIKIDSSP